VSTRAVIPDVLFFFCMGITIASWLALAIAPGRRMVNWWLCGVATPIVLALIYGYLLVAYWDQPPGESLLAAYLSRFGSLPGVFMMFHNPGLLLVGWLDILAMDLVGGAWQARRAQRTGMPRLLLLFSFFMTVTNAPLGMLTYFLIESARGTLSRNTD